MALQRSGGGRVVTRGLEKETQVRSTGTGREYASTQVGGCNGAGQLRDARGLGLAAENATTNESGAIAVYALVCIPSSHGRTDARTHGLTDAQQDGVGDAPTKHGSQGK
jgi:hypothetical protein